MNKAPAFQLYSNDFLVDTMAWSAFEVGIYIRLLLYQWTNESIPEDPERLARIAGVDLGNFKKAWLRVVGGKFVKAPQNDDLGCGGGLINLRLEKTRKEQEEVKEKAIESGRLGAEKRWKDHIKKDSNPIGNPINNPNSENMALQSSSSIKEYIPPVLEEPKQDAESKKLKPKKPAKVWEPKSDQYLLAKFLLEQIIENSPKATRIKALNNGQRESTLQSWCVEIDKLLRIDKIDRQIVADVIEWATEHKFWGSNILSAGNLRDKWDKLIIQKEKRA